jgi:hypothetical protein
METSDQSALCNRRERRRRANARILRRFKGEQGIQVAFKGGGARIEST